MHLWGCVGMMWAQIFSLQGEVRTPDGEPLSHTIVRLPQTGFQTVSNAEGRFTLSVAAETLIIELKHLGYRPRRDTLYRGQASSLYTFVLYPQEVRLGGVIITEGGKDPAEILVRKAIAAKAQNRGCLPAFRVETYTLFTARWLEPPSPLLQKLIKQPIGRQDVLLMSETFSHIYFVAPDNYREEILRSRFVGTRSYSFLGGWIFQGFDPYGERLSLEEITETPFVLPLAKDAPLYYRYRLIGSYWEEDNLFYKIAIEPQSRSSPCVEGYILLADESYALVGLEWQVRKGRPIRYADSLGVRVTYVSLGGCYQIGEISFRGHFRVSLPLAEIALIGEGYAAYRRYDRLVLSSSKKPRRKQGTPPPRSSSSVRAETLQVERLDFGEMVRILPQAEKGSSAFWDSIRQAPLDTQQLLYLARHDTMIAEQDTASRQRGRSFRVSPAGIRWSHRQTFPLGYREMGLQAEWISYTPLEGWTLPLYLIWKQRRDNIIWETSALLRYGLGWQRIAPLCRIERQTTTYPLWRVQLAGGIQIQEPTEFVQIPFFWNVVYRLVGRETGWQGYPSPFLQVGIRRYLHRTVEAQLQLRWDERAENPQREPIYSALRGRLWIEWRPGTRTFTTPRSTRFLSPDRVLTWFAQGGVETACIKERLLTSLSVGGGPRLSVSPFGRVELFMGGAWQSFQPPWADGLYIPATALLFHRGAFQFTERTPYESMGRWASFLFLSWLPEGAILRLFPLLKRTSWKEVVTVRALYTASARLWHLEGSLYLTEVNLRFRKTGIGPSLSFGLHVGGERQTLRLTLAVGSFGTSPPLLKPPSS
ncbi:MAG: DUF5686 and carboxypeptidase regulatory-like domain-containing protein [Bacteroidia bacterium]|nr:DUF5686 and carboxypeptidase regulatory-like domain-containing protein [Bacteroidia bacterium]